ncbi:hypothetical protein [Mumia sp. DW29H23]
MRYLKWSKSSSTPRFPAFRVGNGNRDSQRMSAELAAIRSHSDVTR